MVALAIFLVGSVGIIALFVTASVLHVDATNRRQASFIADGLLSDVRRMRFRDIFATTTLAADINGTTARIPAYRLSPDGMNWAASSDHYPVNEILRTTPSGASVPASRNTGAILIEGEWIWYKGFAPSQQFVGCVRGLNLNGDGVPHEAGDRVLQARTWHYVLDTDLDQPQHSPGPDVTSVTVIGNPISQPTSPQQGFIAIDGEWIRYTSRSWDRHYGRFYWEDSLEDRGFGLTAVGCHNCGTPVTVAREHPHCPGFYYTVQFYPPNAVGAESHVIVCIGYGTHRRFRVHTFRSIWAPVEF